MSRFLQGLYSGAASHLGQSLWEELGEGDQLKQHVSREAESEVAPGLNAGSCPGEVLEWILQVWETFARLCGEEKGLSSGELSSSSLPYRGKRPAVDHGLQPS